MLGLKLLRQLTDQGLRIFSIKQAEEAAPKIGMSASYVAVSLHHLLTGGWIMRLKRGVYAIAAYGPTPHEFSIAMALVNPSAISHWTAMHYHHLTQQTPNKIFAITPRETSIPRSLGKKTFHFIRIKKEYFFGIETVWLDDMQVQITNLEKTLVDGLYLPEYCGDFAEVLYAYKISKDRINIDLIVQYGLKLGIAVAKRLGLILERLDVPEKKLLPLLNLHAKNYHKFDPRGPLNGAYNRKWMIQENIGFP